MEEIFRTFDIWGYYIIAFLTIVAIVFVGLFAWLFIFGFKNAYKIIVHIKKFQSDYESVCNRLMKKLERTKDNIKNFENSLDTLRININGVNNLINSNKIQDGNQDAYEDAYEDIREFVNDQEEEEEEEEEEAQTNDINFLRPKFSTARLQNLFTSEQIQKYDDTYKSIIK